MGIYLGGQKISPIIKVRAEINNQDKTITENGTYTADTGYTGLGEVTVNVPSEQPVITELNVTPTTSAQTIVAPSDTDGYSPVKVSAVTSSIDSNIVAGNIKKNVNILGVVGTLEEGVTPTGTINITQNGIVDVTNYASANVNVAGGGGIVIPREIDTNGNYGYPSKNFEFSLPSNVIDIRSYGLEYAFRGCKSLIGINISSLTNISGSSCMYYTFMGCTGLTGTLDLSNLTTITGSNSMVGTFRQCTGLTSVDLSSLTTISGSGAYQMYSTFSECTGLTSVDLSSLTTISVESGMTNTFGDCSNLTSVDLSNLTTISGSSGMYTTFDDCVKLTSINLSKLTTISSSQGMYGTFEYCRKLTSVDLSSLAILTGRTALRYAFQYCTSLTSLSFPALTSTSFGSYTNQFNNMLQGVTGCTVHFPSNLQSVIGSWSDVTAGFGGTNTTVLFDLPATT